MSVKQEMLLERHWKCNLCGTTGVETSEVSLMHERLGYCCGSTSIREIPGQLLISDAGGAWIRRRPA